MSAQITLTATITQTTIETQETKNGSQLQIAKGKVTICLKEDKTLEGVPFVAYGAVAAAIQEQINGTAIVTGAMKTSEGRPIVDIQRALFLDNVVQSKLQKTVTEPVAVAATPCPIQEEEPEF